MADISHIADQFGKTVEPRILEQYMDSSRWKEIIKSVIDRMQDIEDASFELAHVLDFTTETPIGSRLDWIAGLINVKRFNGESDQDFFGRFVAAINRNNAGTSDNVIYNVAILSGDLKPQYMDEVPATFFVYTGPRPDGDGGFEQGGNQLSRSQVRQLSPAGVLGLPGAAINVGDDTTEGNEELLVDEDGRLILMEADDSTIVREVLLANNNGALLLSSQSVPIRVSLQGAAVPDIPVIETTWNGVTVDAVRIKDLPDAGGTNAFFVRDSDSEGTVRTRAITQEALDELWENTPAEL